jgi:hypothetical protein
MSPRIANLARRVDSDPFFLAGALRRYAAVHHLDEPAVAAALGCTVETLALVALCRRPMAPHHAEDFTRIAERFGLKAEALVTILQSPGPSG